MQRFIKPITICRLFIFTIILYSSWKVFINYDPYKHLYINYRKDIQCDKLFSNDKFEQKKALHYTLKDYKEDPSYNYSNIKDCALFTADRKYITSFTSVEESRFPIAFSIMMHKDVGQFERLLRAIYRVQNFYCIHVDLNSSNETFKSVSRIASCFPNVLLASKRFGVKWGTFTLLEADLQCIRDLHKNSSTWKYLLNLTGQEFPLKTNLELVRILKMYDGANNIDGTIKNRNMWRIIKKKMSFNVTWIKGSIHITASREFVTFMLTSNRSNEMLNSLKEYGWYRVPDEQFYATLNHNSQTIRAPGAYLITVDTPNSSNNFLTRFKNWGGMPCQSRFIVRQICIWGIKDLPTLFNRPELFVNKLYWNFQPHTLNCLEELNRNRTIKNMMTLKTDINLEFYGSQSFVKNHLKP